MEITIDVLDKIRDEDIERLKENNILFIEKLNIEILARMIRKKKQNCNLVKEYIHNIITKIKEGENIYISEEKSTELKKNVKLFIMYNNTQ